LEIDNSLEINVAMKSVRIDVTNIRLGIVLRRFDEH
jgi:hypothetical protein